MDQRALPGIPEEADSAALQSKSKSPQRLGLTGSPNNAPDRVAAPGGIGSLKILCGERLGSSRPTKVVRCRNWLNSTPRPLGGAPAGFSQATVGTAAARWAFRVSGAYIPGFARGMPQMSCSSINKMSGAEETLATITIKWPMGSK
jgi:hypothetical protein